MLRETPTQPYNPLRILEWVLCTICLILAIYIIVRVSHIHMVVKALLLLAAGAFSFITLVDIIVTSLLKPLQWTSWIVFALTGALLFFLCSGILIFQSAPLGMTLYVGTLIATCVTGFVFILEPLSIISQLLTTETELKPILDPNCCPSSSRVKLVKEGCDKECQCPGDGRLPVEHNDDVRCGNHQAKGKHTYTDIYTKKYLAPKVPSHGGTFHVSRDIAPMLAPSTVRHTRCSYSSDVSPSRCSPVSADTTNTTLYQKDRSLMAKAPPSIEFRTVFHSPKTDRGCAKQKISKNSVGCGRPQTSPVQNQTQPHLLSAQHQYKCTCPRCGGGHQHIVTVQQTPNRDVQGSCRWQGLPTVEENYGLTDAPVKDYPCCPCPSPPTASNANQGFSTPDTPRSCGQNKYEKNQGLSQPCFKSDITIDGKLFDSDSASARITEMPYYNYFFEGERAESACGTDQETVLPGAADSSPRSAERYTPVPCQSQKPTIINMEDDTINSPIRYLVPMENCRNQATAANRNDKKCSLM